MRLSYTLLILMIILTAGCSQVPTPVSSDTSKVEIQKASSLTVKEDKEKTEREKFEDEYQQLMKESRKMVAEVRKEGSLPFEMKQRLLSCTQGMYALPWWRSALSLSMKYDEKGHYFYYDISVKTQGKGFEKTDKLILPQGVKLDVYKNHFLILKNEKGFSKKIVGKQVNTDFLLVFPRIDVLDNLEYTYVWDVQTGMAGQDFNSLLAEVSK